MTHLYARLSGALLLLLLLAAPAQAAEVIPATVVDGAVVWTPSGEYGQATLTLSAPMGLEYRRAFAPAEAIRLHPSELGDLPLPNGFYAYELIVTQSHTDSDEPVSAVMQTGTIEVRDGAAVASELLDFVINDDLIVDGSACVGFDCVNGEVFGFDTIRIKENNLRIRAVDTSNSASFPTQDWELTFNDSTNGGQDRFSVTAISPVSSTPFTIEAGSNNNALYVDDGGRIGLGTSTPVVELHVVDGDTPTMRLEQDGSSGFTAQTWDVASNETNFFIRDVTNGSRLPFRIRPGAATSSIDIGADGRVGIGTSSLSRDGVPGGSGEYPSGRDRLVIFEVDGDVDNDLDLNEDTDKVALFNSDVEMMGELDVAGRTRIDGVLRVEGETNLVDKLNVQARFNIDVPFLVGNVIDVQNSALAQVMLLNANGNLDILGTLTQGSDVNNKTNIVPVDSDAILEGVLGLPIAHWEYLTDPGGVVHLGPMAQDFYAAFGLGARETGIASIDSDGVALASVQALAARNAAATARIAELEAANTALEARLARLEALLGADHE